MKFFIFLIGWGCTLVSYASTWQPICPEYTACAPTLFSSAPPNLHPSIPATPFVNRSGSLWLQYGDNFDYQDNLDRPWAKRKDFYLRPSDLNITIVESNTDRLQNFIGTNPSFIPLTGLNAFNNGVNGEVLVFGHVIGVSGGLVSRYSEDGELLASVNYLNGQPIPDNDPLFILSFTQAQSFGTPAKVGDTFYAGLSSGSGPIIARSNDGQQWESLTPLPFPDQLEPPQPGLVVDTRTFYNLTANPSNDRLWALVGDPIGTQLPYVFATEKAALWESQDHGKNWIRVDDGSFPDQVGRVVNDTITGLSYALTANGLYVSNDKGQSWLSTGLKTTVYELKVIPTQGNDSILVAGIDSGVVISRDGGSRWQSMNSGLLSIPHTVQYTQGTLIAASAAGYFLCQDLNCFGDPLPASVPTDIFTNLPPRTIAAIEFYNRNLDHYFLTSDIAEAVGIDEGLAGPGWERTGHSFKVWPNLGAPTGTHVCRFYGSVNPGPNSHFFSISPAECSQLLKLQDSIPEDKPRWHLESYAFMAVPTKTDGTTCPDQYQPVYRAYNNGFSQGKDSNHRFVTDRNLLEPLFANGWLDEGVGFCIPK